MQRSQGGGGWLVLLRTITEKWYWSVGISYTVT